MSNKPRFPKCGSNDLWDDNFWEGCNKCDYIHNSESHFNKVGFNIKTNEEQDEKKCGN